MSKGVKLVQIDTGTLERMMIMGFTVGYKTCALKEVDQDIPDGVAAKRYFDSEFKRVVDDYIETME